MANFRGGWTPPRHSGTWVGARVASLRCHYPPPRRSQYSRNAEARLHKSKTSCRGGHRRGTTTSGPGRGPLAGFEVTLYGRFWGDRRGLGATLAYMIRPSTTHAPNNKRGKKRPGAADLWQAPYLGAVGGFVTGDELMLDAISEISGAATFRHPRSIEGSDSFFDRLPLVGK